MFLKFLILALIVTTTFALPVTKRKAEEKVETSTAAPPSENSLEYERYLKEVVEALESDPNFRQKLNDASEVDIRNGKIAQELEFVNHHVRSKLDEIKRREIERLAELANKEYELRNDIDRDHLKVPQHLDHHNEHTFEIDDLRKLIQKTSEDLVEADRKRREEFKIYEMQKEFEREEIKNELNPEQRKKFEEELKAQEVKHKKHEKVHHPGNRAQLEEVWEKQDHMEPEDFEPKKFFVLHDLDGNGYWDENELKALFVKELDKVYQSGLPEDDIRERTEEMERMREHVFAEIDKNKDSLISLQEFLNQSVLDDFTKDPEWETVEAQPQYTHEEYLEFEKRRHEEVQRMIAQGLLPPHPNLPEGYHLPVNHNEHNPQQEGAGAYNHQQANQPQPVEQVHLKSNFVYDVHQAHQAGPQQQQHQEKPQVYQPDSYIQQQHQPANNAIPQHQ